MPTAAGRPAGPDRIDGQAPRAAATRPAGARGPAILRHRLHGGVRPGRPAHGPRGARPRRHCGQDDAGVALGARPGPGGPGNPSAFLGVTERPRTGSRRLPGAPVETVERAGHAPHLEEPEAVARLVLDSLGGNGGSGAAL